MMSDSGDSKRQVARRLQVDRPLDRVFDCLRDIPMVTIEPLPHVLHRGRALLREVPRAAEVEIPRVKARRLVAPSAALRIDGTTQAVVFDRLLSAAAGRR